jgi:uncharacterized protein DUF4232
MLLGGAAMRPARIIAAVLFAAAVAVTGCTAHSTAAHPSAAPQTPASAPPVHSAPTTKPQTDPRPDTPPSTTSLPGDRPAIGRCDTSALRGSVQGTEGAAGTLYVTVELHNVSARTCTVKGIPDVRLLGALGQPVTPPSEPAMPGGSLVTLRPGAAARLVFRASNVCDSTVRGSRIRVTLTPGEASLVVKLGNEPGLATCRSLRVQPLEPATG